MTLRFALVGCGDFGRHLGRYLLEVADITALCDPRPGAAADTARALGLEGAALFDDHRRLLDAKVADAVAITAANHAHAAIAVDAARAGLHVFCEKAMARTVPECWRMVRACRQAGVRLMVGHKRRLRPPWARMIELTRDSGPLGAPTAITVAGYCDLRPYHYEGTWWADPALSGGFLHVNGVHVVDWMRAMCGDARRVTAHWGPHLDRGYGFPDVLHTTFRFAGGAVATLNGALTSPLRRFREAQGPRVACRHGALELDPHMDYIDLAWQRLDEEAAHRERFDDLGFDHAYRLEVGDFVRWVEEGRPPCLTWEEGLRCVELMEAAHRSADAGGGPVDLPLYPELEDGRG